MTIVTLTTDFGTKDYYAGQFKGTLLSHCRDLNIVDISHQVTPFNIVEAAFTFKNVWSSFPEGSIHILHVYNREDDHREMLYLYQAGHHFIGPNNGLFTLIFEEQLPAAYLLSEISGLPFQSGFAAAKATQNIVNQIPPEKWARPAEGLEQRINLRPVIYPSRILGFVMHIDIYENAITNISEELFRQVGQGRPFSINFKGHRPVTGLSDYYQDVSVGEIVCLFNAAGLLEIAVNMGKAKSLFSLGIDEPVQIDFQHAHAQEIPEN